MPNDAQTDAPPRRSSADIAAWCGVIATVLVAVIGWAFFPSPPAAQQAAVQQTATGNGNVQVNGNGNTINVNSAEVVQKLTEVYEQRLRDAQSHSEEDRRKATEELARVREQNAELIKAVTGLAERKAQQPTEAVKIDVAIQALKEGRTAEAEAIFKRVFEERKAAGDAAHQDAAAAARHLGALAYMNDPKSALVWYRHATELEPDDPEGWLRLGNLLVRTGELTEAVTAYEKLRALGEQRSEKGWIAAATGNLGLIAETRGDLPLAEEYFHKALNIEKELGRKNGMAVAYSNLSRIADDRGDQLLAEEYQRKAMALDEELGNKEGIADNFDHIGMIAKARGDLPLAMEYLHKALVLHEELGDKEGIATEYGNLGLIARMRGDLPSAVEHHRKALALDEELGNMEGIANDYVHLGFVYGDLHDFAQARAYWQKALTLYREIGMPHMVKLVEGWLRELGGAAKP